MTMSGRGQEIGHAAALIAAALLSFVADRRMHAADATPAATTPAPITEPAVPGAEALARAFLEDVRHDRLEAAFAKMERRYREAASVADLRRGVDEVEAAYGQLLEYQYKTRQDAARLYPDQTIKPVSKIWFAARTGKHETGVYSAVEVVPDDGQPAVAAFSTVTFPNQLPDALR
jgi:hypothetical protein